MSHKPSQAIVLVQNTIGPKQPGTREPWRPMVWDDKSRTRYTDYIRKYKHDICDDIKARVLLVGPVGAGKSSFFNSFNSVVKGHVTSQAMSGTSATSVTTKFRAYSLKGRTGCPLPLVLCDTMGLEGDEARGLHPDDVFSIINGHVSNLYEFSPHSPIQEKTPGFVSFPSFMQKVHCVTYVVDACTVPNMPASLRRKLQDIHHKVNKLGIPQMVLMTKVDQACPDVARNIKNVYLSLKIKQQACTLSEMLGLPLSCIVPVKNYSHELDVDKDCDLLLLSAAVQMLRFAENYFDEMSDLRLA